VRDIEQKIEAYCRVFGFDRPEVIITDAPEKARAAYRGKPTSAQAKLAFMPIGSVQLELIQPLGGDSTWQEFLDTHGEGVHHIAFEVKGTDGVTRRLAEQKMDVVQQGYYEGGMYTYVDGTSALGVILELLENF
jgi:methylmalonyl-CoA/ethylmalonyl-CoA epimerase